MSINQQNGRKLALTIHNSIKDNNIKSLEKNVTFNETIETKEETSNELLSKILDTINSNSLNIFYPDSNSDFKKKIDSLNLKFYLETEKYLSNKNRSEKCQTSLFIILFKQINIYIEEIERLNLIIIKRKYEPEKIIERTDEIIKKQNEFLIKEKIIQALKESKSNMEIKLLESIINEDKLKKEIQMLKIENENLKNQNYNNNNNNNRKNNTIKLKSQKNKSNNISHKLTHQNFHSSTFKNLTDDENNLPISYTNKNLDLYYKNNIENGGNDRKRNNSDNNKNNLNNSFIKYEKIGADKLLFKNYLKKKDNIKKYSNNKHNSAITRKPINILNNSQISKFKVLNKRKTNNINFKNGKENKNNTNNNFVDTNNNQTKVLIYDTYRIRPVKTEYKINDLNDYKKGFLYENNSAGISNDNRKSKDKNKDLLIAKFSNNGKDKKEKYFLEKENIKNQNNKEKIIQSSFNQITIGYGTNIKKKQKVKI